MLPWVDKNLSEDTSTVRTKIVARIGRNGDVDHGVEESLKRQKKSFY